MTEIYLDNAATTRVHEQCAGAAMDVMLRFYGNPSSTHAKGLEARDILESARAAAAKAIGARTDEMFFTSGGTEANNLAVKGGARSKKRLGKRIITTSIEHPSVLESVRSLEAEGFEPVFLPADRYGHVWLESLDNALTGDTVLVSMMYVNNEVGSILPVHEAGKLIKKKAPNALFHCDCVQAFGKMPVKVRDIGCDMLSFSGHKIHAPKGVGALYVKNGVRLSALTSGGSQQNGVRPGTEPLPSIAAFGEAIRECVPVSESTAEHYKALNALARDRLSKIDGLVFNSPEDGAPCILNFSTCRVMSETMLNYLSSQGIYVSNGSACKGNKKSHIIEALAMPDRAAKSVLRVSFSRDTTPDEVERMCDFVALACRELANFR